MSSGHLPCADRSGSGDQKNLITHYNIKWKWHGELIEMLLIFVTDDWLNDIKHRRWYIWSWLVTSKMMLRMSWPMIPFFKAVLEKSALASQPTVSRFFNRMNEDTLKLFQEISQILRKRIYSIQIPQAMILDLDSTLLATYGKQEGRAFNFHYQSNGYL